MSFRSLLQQACTYGFLDIARLLLAKGAFLEHTDSGGRSAFIMLWFQLARSFSRVDFLKVLLAYSPMPCILDPSDGFGAFACAAMRGNASDLETLMTCGAYQKAKDRAGDRIIKYSVIGSNPATYDFLEPFMPVGWVSEVDYRGRGPLHIALECPSPHAREIVQRLLHAGADVHLRAADGNDPGDLARICDARAESTNLGYCGVPGNYQAYFEALKSAGFEVELDDEGDLWWVAF